MACILWDWDGVLADSLNLYFELYQHVSGHFGKGLPISTEAEFREWYQPRWELNYQEMGFGPGEIEQALDYSFRWLDYNRVELFPGVPEMLRDLSQEWRMAIVSTTPSTMIRPRLAREGLDGLFAVITGGEDGSSEKVEKIASTLAFLGTRSAVMVGDTFLDVEAARHHGLKTIAATYGWQTPERVLAAGPDRRVDSPEQMERTVREVMHSLGAAM